MRLTRAFDALRSSHGQDLCQRVFGRPLPPRDRRGTRRGRASSE